MGIVIAPEESPYAFKSDSGAILLIVEAEQLLSSQTRDINAPTNRRRDLAE